MSVAQLPIDVQLSQDKFARPQTVPEAPEGISAMVHRALAQPLEFPPLRDSVFPGDKLVVVLHADVPQADSLIQAVVDYLKSANLPLQDATFLTSMTLQRQPLDVPDAESYVVHDLEDEHAVAYIGATDAGDPVYINRVLFDADVILPIHFVSYNDEIDEDCVYPRYSSAATIGRFHQNLGSKKSRLAEVELANEQLGVFVSMQVIAGPGGQVQEIIYGNKRMVEKEARKKARSLWAVAKQTAAQLVIATMESNPRRQTWQQFCQAILAANRVVDDCGQIVICSELAEVPGRKLRQILQLQFETDPESVAKILQNSSTTLRNVAEIVSEKTVYLQSQLTESVVEELGLGYIKSPDELQRLVDRVESGVLIRDAHLCRIVA